MLDPEKIEVNDSLKFTTPKGKIVYGGGGIIPDVFVPIDTSTQNETLSYLLNRGFISYFVFEELDKDRKVYEGVTQEDFINNFIVSDDIVVRFQDYLSVRSQHQITFVAYNETVKQYIKATLAEQLFGREAFEQIINENDTMIEEVIKLSYNE